MIQMFPARAMVPAWIKVAVIALAGMAVVAVAAQQWDRLWSWLPWSDERRLEAPRELMWVAVALIVRDAWRETLYIVAPSAQSIVAGLAAWRGRT